MAKLNRESKLRERRLDKQARKDARKYASAHPEEAADTRTAETGESGSNAERPAREADVPALADAR